MTWPVPYHIEQSGSQFCVVKDDDGKKMGCHPTKQKAQAQLAALNIAMKKKGEMSVEDWSLAMGWATANAGTNDRSTGGT